ncbi:hypothetical protein EVAR_32347_1 [Eumeta japonica]|uniref:Uncharacterized protein n=1 Tax=Eumeta variegata TaxID=151549 RepID=A0A4C1Z7C4_EUMVA|nr:hypothetical protein EVAR_32347_1 [Eumeta japonica]
MGPTPRVASLHECTLPGQRISCGVAAINDGQRFLSDFFIQPSFTCDGYDATVSNAPLPPHFIGGASVAHHYTSGHGTAVASADTSTTIFETPQNATSRLDVHTRTWLSGPGTYASVGPRHIGRRALGGAPESVGNSSTTLLEVIGEAPTRAPVCRPEEHVVVEVACCGSAAGAPDQEVVSVRPRLGRFDVHLRQRSGVDNVLVSSSRVWRTFALLSM